MLKIKIDAASYEQLPKDIKAEYKKVGDDYTLDLDGYEDPVELKKAKDREVQARKDASAKVKDLETQLHSLTEERDGLLSGAIPKADVAKLTKSYDDKIAKIQKELGDQNVALNSQLQTMLVDNVANQLASKISISPEVIYPHIKSRLKADKDEAGKFITKVVDATGAPSALTLADLEKEFVANKAFAPIITGSKASGAGGSGGGSGGGANGAKSIDWSKPLTPKEIAAGLRAGGKIADPVATAE